MPSQNIVSVGRHRSLPSSAVPKVQSSWRCESYQHVAVARAGGHGRIDDAAARKNTQSSLQLHAGWPSGPRSDVTRSGLSTALRIAEEMRPLASSMARASFAPRGGSFTGRACEILPLPTRICHAAPDDARAGLRRTAAGPTSSGVSRAVGASESHRCHGRPGGDMVGPSAADRALATLARVIPACGCALDTVTDAESSEVQAQPPR
jgi:hypothetical protein